MSEETEQKTCPRMDENCKFELANVLMDISQDWLAAHNSDLSQDKGNDAIRWVLTKMLENLPTAEKIREEVEMVARSGGQMGEA